VATVTFIRREDPNVMLGMETFFRLLASNHNFGVFPKQWTLPYTNVMSFDLDWVRSTELQGIMSAVYESGCIISNRWGDLPLWGATAALLHIDIPRIQLEYYHGSHYLIASPEHMVGEASRVGLVDVGRLAFLIVSIISICACIFMLRSKCCNYLEMMIGIVYNNYYGYQLN
jgi:hypothetical protein